MHTAGFPHINHIYNKSRSDYHQVIGSFSQRQRFLKCVVSVLQCVAVCCSMLQRVAVTMIYEMLSKLDFTENPCLVKRNPTPP